MVTKKINHRKYDLLKKNGFTEWETSSNFKKTKIERKNGQRVCFIAANSELYHLAFDITDHKNCVYPDHVV